MDKDNRTSQGVFSERNKDDLAKRKRQSDKEEPTEREEQKLEAFKRSRKIERSPVKQVNLKQVEKEENEQEMEEVKKLLLEMRKEMNDGFKENKQEIKTLENEMKLLKQEMQKKEESWNAEKKELIEKTEEQNRKIVEIENKLDSWEKEKRRNNIVISGIKINTTNKEILKEGTQNFIKDAMKVDVKIKSVYKIGPEICVAEINSWEEKMDIMKNKNKLRESNVYINNDLTKKERAIQAEIRNIAKQEKENGNKTKIGYQKLLLNGKRLVWNKREGRLVEQVDNPDQHPKN